MAYRTMMVSPRNNWSTSIVTGLIRLRGSSKLLQTPRPLIKNVSASSTACTPCLPSGIDLTKPDVLYNYMASETRACVCVFDSFGGEEVCEGNSGCLRFEKSKHEHH